MSSSTKKKERYHLIDALRGFSIILMVGYHFGMTLIYMGMAEKSLVFNPLLNFLQPVFAGVFILLSGISCRFSRSNIRRGLIVLALALGLTVVTSFFGLNVWFGILHFLGMSMVIYGLLSRFIDKIPLFAGIYVLLVVFILCYNYFPRAADNNYFCWLGFITEDFSPADYFPFLRWFPLFLLGVQIGLPIKEHKLPVWFYRFNMPFLPYVGRHTLIIYLAHQPIFYGLLTLYSKIRG